MIGNDVVDLGDDETRANAQHPRFDARVFTAAERRRIATSEDPARMRWILWAAKESAYKVARRGDSTTVFSPRAFSVHLAADLKGYVLHRGHRYALQVAVCEKFVHAVATLEGSAPMRSLVSGVTEVDAIDDGAAAHVARSLALRELAPAFGASLSELAIERERRIPQLRLRGRRAQAALSLSHHGRFAAFACLRPGDAAQRDRR